MPRTVPDCRMQRLPQPVVASIRAQLYTFGHRSFVLSVSFCQRQAPHQAVVGKVRCIDIVEAASCRPGSKQSSILSKQQQKQRIVLVTCCKTLRSLSSCSNPLLLCQRSSSKRQH
jgi:hypothetical protein